MLLSAASKPARNILVVFRLIVLETCYDLLYSYSILLSLALFPIALSSSDIPIVPFASLFAKKKMEER